MPTYKWVGKGLTYTDQSKFDWNTPSNWYERKFDPAQGTVTYRLATTAPGALDEVWIGFPVDPRDLCFPGAPLPESSAPVPLCPLLYGGFSGTVAGGTWINSAQSSGGHTFNTSCSRIAINLIHEYRDSGSGQTYSIVRSHYPFDFVGGGLTGEMLEYAESFGVTLFNLSDIRTQSLKLKSDFYRIIGRGDKPQEIVGFSLGNSPIKIAITPIKSLAQLGGGTGSSSGNSGPTTPLVTCNLYAESNGTVVINGGVFNSIQVFGKDTSQFEMPKPANFWMTNLVFDKAIVSHQAKNFFIGCTGNYFRYGLAGFAGPWVSGAELYFDATLDTNYVLNELYPLGGVSGSARYGDNVLEIVPVRAANNGGTGNYPINIGDGFSNNRRYIGYIDAYQYASHDSDVKYDIKFVGPVSINTMRCTYHNIFADITPNIITNSVNIGTLHLRDEGTLSFRAPPISSGGNGFDFWYFGTTAANNGISGGIIFDDETGKILGSEGTRLFNTKFKTSNRTDSRLSSIVSSTKAPISGVGDVQA